MKTCLQCCAELNKSAKLYCSTNCLREKQWVEFKADPNAIWLPRRMKRLLLEELGHQCQKCRNTEWMGQPIALELEHIDGNSENNTRENCTLLCCNCHAQTPTYKNRNKGNGRHARRERYREGLSY